MLLTTLPCCGKCLPNRCLTTIRGYTHRSTLSFHDTDRKENDGSNNSPIVACIRYSKNMFTEPLPSNDRRDTHIYTQTDGRHLWSKPLRLPQVAWYITKFHTDWFRHSNVDRGDTQTHRRQGGTISLLLFFQNKESRLISGMQEHKMGRKSWKWNTLAHNSACTTPVTFITFQIVSQMTQQLYE
jgi:hypothetical protein